MAKMESISQLLSGVFWAMLTLAESACIGVGVAGDAGAGSEPKPRNEGGLLRCSALDEDAGHVCLLGGCTHHAGVAETDGNSDKSFFLRFPPKLQAHCRRSRIANTRLICFSLLLTEYLLTQSQITSSPHKRGVPLSTTADITAEQAVDLRKELSYCHKGRESPEMVPVGHNLKDSAGVKRCSSSEREHSGKESGIIVNAESERIERMLDEGIAFNVTSEVEGLTKSKDQYFKENEAMVKDDIILWEAYKVTVKGGDTLADKRKRKGKCKDLEQEIRQMIDSPNHKQITHHLDHRMAENKAKATNEVKLLYQARH
ncbi:hypothetical protein NDU88_004886 [Pleurodeles waltl]|uniref:Uncharacterized protein n=1 Tax=Pleurodeles waltl TaxID=8319 RepID=A0AAV7TSQ3_PLEWA|nr:hypothetical protein NDU88_004886 [Pleurodeles waltl]